MTIETPQASRPLHSTTMFANSPSVFHDYAASPINSDHSLHTDLRFPSSPNSLTMYDGDTEFLPSSLGSMCSEASFVDTGQQQEEFDLKPQFECTDNTFLHQCLDIPADGSGRDDTLVVRSDPAWSPTEASLMKMEDIFQVDQKDAIQGPTLAELNFDDSLSVYDDIVKEDEQQKRLVSGGCTLWQQSIQSGMDTTYSAPQVVLGGQKAPIKFTTCTVTSPTATAIDMRIGAVDKTTVSSSLSTLPQSLYSVTAKLSLFSEPAPVVKQEQGMDLSNRSCNATCLKVPHGSGLTLLTPHTVMPQPQPLAAPVANKVPTENTLSPMAMETEEPKSSLQRLLSDPLPVVIKTEPMDIPMATSVPASMWTPNAPVSAPQPMQISSSAPTVGMFAPPFGLKSTKRARSPEIETSVSTSSMEQKWEEIKQFIYDEEQSREEELAERLLLFRQRQREQQQQQQQQLPLQQPQHQPQPLQPQSQEPHQPEQQKGTEEPQTALTPSKRVKTEPKDPAFTVKDEVDSADEDIDSDPEDSDDGGDSVIGRDLDDHSDADSEFLLMDDNATSTKGPPRYFWMYNTQSKGPKGKRLCKAVNTVDPYTLNDFEDPVFDPVLNQTQYKHNGKARRGDGNDITPSPQKLYALGNELKKLNRIINDLTPVSELPAGARSKSRKEKNKLASRACRLKKKAQHEANKVKLFGLEKEHHDLLTVLSEIREKVFKMVRSGKVPTKDDYLSPMLERLMKLHLTHMIAGHTADYVNSVLAKVMSGDPAGGLAL